MGYKAAILDWRDVCDETGTGNINQNSLRYLTKSTQQNIEYTPYIYAFIDSDEANSANDENNKAERKRSIIEKLKAHNINFDEKAIFCFTLTQDKRRTIDYANDGKKLVCKEMNIKSEDVLVIERGSKIIKSPPATAGSNVDDGAPPVYRRPRGLAPNPNWDIKEPLLPQHTVINYTYSRAAKAAIGGFAGLATVLLLAAIGTALFFFCPPAAPFFALVAFYPVYSAIAAGALALSIIVGGALIGGSRSTTKIERTDNTVTIEGSNLADIQSGLDADAALRGHKAGSRNSKIVHFDEESANDRRTINDMEDDDDQLKQTEKVDVGASTAGIGMRNSR